MNKIVTLVVIGVVVILGIILFSSYVSTSNTEISMRKQIEAQQEVCASFYDKVWKIISQKAQVSSEYKNGFNEIYTNIMQGRYQNGGAQAGNGPQGSAQNGGSLMKWIQEANPEFDVSLYKDLMRSIEVERNGYLKQEQKLIDLDREHDTYIAIFPNSIFVGGRGETEIKTIRSSRTNNALETGEDNDVDLF